MTVDQVWKILLVEDSEDDYILTRAMLNDVKAGGYEMVWADRYAQALDILQSFQPDVALLDYNLGQYNGVDLLHAIRERGFRFPVILLTGKASYAIDLKAMQAGVSDFIEKDQMSGAQLERAIRYTIEQEQIRARLEQMNEELEARVQERTSALMESNQALADANAALAAANIELRNREALLQQVLEILPVGVWLTDEKGNIRRGNPASHAIWQGARYVGIGEYQEYKGWWLNSGKPIQPNDWAAVRAVTKGETTLNEEIEIQCFDGTRKFILNSAIPLLDDQNQVTGSIIVNQDITERVKAEEQARQAAARMAAQVEISAKIAAARLNVLATLNILAREIAERIGDVCVIALVDEDERTLEPMAFHHSSPEVLAFLMELFSTSPNLYGQGIAGEVARTGQAVLLTEPFSMGVEGKINPHFRAYLSRYGIYSLLIVPLRFQGRVIGTIGVSRDQPGRPYTAEDQLFLQSLSDRAALAIDNARLYETAQVELAERQRVEAELSEIQSRLIDGAEAERLQLARELHDGPIQDLYAIALQLRFLQESDQDEQKRSSLNSLQESIQHVTDTLRAAAVALRPPALTRFGLEPAIRSYCEQFHKVQPNLTIYTDLISNNGQPAPVLSERINLALFRVLQMALTNVARHARARQVSIRIKVEERQVWMEVEDDGIGFQIPTRWVELARQGHLGLVGAIERAEALGGKMSVSSSPGQGTTIRVTLPRVS